MNKKILIVDDEEDLVFSLKRQLRKEPYEVLTAHDVVEAFRVLDHDTVQLILADYRMPTLSGVEFLRQVKQRYPDIVRILISGFIDTNVLMDAINMGEVYRFVAKPWNIRELRNMIREGLEHYNVLYTNRQCMDTILRRSVDKREHSDGRNPALELSASILDDLPFGVLVIDRQHRVLTINRRANEIMKFGQGKGNGMLLDEILPTVAAGTILEGFDNRDGQGKVACPLPGGLYTLMWRRLRDGMDNAKGLVTIHE